MHYSRTPKHPPSKVCDVCEKVFTPHYIESNGNWRKRKTCSYPCSTERSNRLKREQRKEKAA